MRFKHRETEDVLLIPFLNGAARENTQHPVKFEFQIHTNDY